MKTLSYVMLAALLILAATTLVVQAHKPVKPTPFTISAQPIANLPQKNLTILSAGTGRINDQLIILMSDLPDDRITHAGTWVNVLTKTYHHRIRITLTDWPVTIGNYNIDWFEYSINDEDAVYNFGWGPDNLTGTVNITKISKDGRNVIGNINIINTSGGIFNGVFMIGR